MFQNLLGPKTLSEYIRRSIINFIGINSLKICTFYMYLPMNIILLFRTCTFPEETKGLLQSKPNIIFIGEYIRLIFSTK